jgi:threonyl-tRNA synthetase
MTKESNPPALRRAASSTCIHGHRTSPGFVAKRIDETMSKPPTSINQTGKFAVLDLATLKIDHVKNSNSKAAAAGKRDQTRANKESGGRIAGSGLIGGPFKITPNPSFLEARTEVFDRLWARQEAARVESLPTDKSIAVTLPNGDVKTGVAFKTSPYDIAKAISQGLADSIIIAKVAYTSRLDTDADAVVACDEDEEGGEGAGAAAAALANASEGQLWDVTRPLVGDCRLVLLKYDDPQARTVFWHSSAHVLGAAIESMYGAHLTIGPPLQSGFYYDAYMGDHAVSDDDLAAISAKAQEVCNKKFPFQRLVLSKDEALEMFSCNPFKVNLIKNKVPEGSKTTVYKCGPLIDLCMGPHVPNTGKIKAFAAVKTSSTNWLGQVTNDPLQRIYAISFPDKALLKQWQEFQEKAKQRDHRLLGTKQELFFFHTLSPGSCFWLPHGARVYNKLVDFIRGQYWKRGYEEVITPNIFNLQLWETSGHAQHYKENMFTFDVEGQEWGMKPMNCPGHCLMFRHRIRSYRELPLRVADFGVLHRNELSGALTGLTRVRRFQQDDAHIFCRQDQIKEEVLGALDFMRFVYTVFGMSYKLELSTRPAKALGDTALWDLAEEQLAIALNEFAGEGNWKVNPGDGAFYGPKIDIKVFDALERVHQCATVQLDFQLPIRFDLEYKAAAEGDESFQRPVMVHRAMLGSVERMFAVLSEHWGGKWPFWLSPRQVIIVPVDLKYIDYAFELQQLIHDAGYYVEVDDSTRTLNKKVREAQLAQFNFILVVGQQEVDARAVNIRTRENEVQGTVSIPEFIEKLKKLEADYQ